MKEINYIKIEVRGSMACYMQSDLFPKFFSEYIQNSSQRTMIQYSDFAIDLQTNEFIKCRLTLTDLFDRGFPRPVLTMYFVGVK